jgi:competence protein ComEA
MSFYRTLLAAVAAIAIASPVFADDAATTDAAAQAPTATSETTAATTTSQAETTATDKTAAATQVTVNVNKATAKELLKVKGLNAAKARAIVAYRKKHGEFKSIDDLAKVKALSKLTADSMQAIEGQLTLN